MFHRLSNFCRCSHKWWHSIHEPSLQVKPKTFWYTSQRVFRLASTAQCSLVQALRPSRSQPCCSAPRSAPSFLQLLCLESTAQSNEGTSACSHSGGPQQLHTTWHPTAPQKDRGHRLSCSRRCHHPPLQASPNDLANQPSLIPRSLVLLEVVVEEVVTGFLEVVSVASSVVGMTPLDAKALLQTGSPLGFSIGLAVLNPGSRFGFVGSCRSKKPLEPDPSQPPAETPLMSAHWSLQSRPLSAVHLCAEDALDGSVGTGGLALDLGALGAGAVGAAFGTGANPIPLTSQTSSSSSMSFSLISQRAMSHNFPAWSCASVLASALTCWQWSHLPRHPPDIWAQLVRAFACVRLQLIFKNSRAHEINQPRATLLCRFLLQ